MLERAVLVPLATRILTARCEQRELRAAVVQVDASGDLAVAVS